METIKFEDFMIDIGKHTIVISGEYSIYDNTIDMFKVASCYLISGNMARKINHNKIKVNKEKIEREEERLIWAEIERLKKIDAEDSVVYKYENYQR